MKIQIIKSKDIQFKPETIQAWKQVQEYRQRLSSPGFFDNLWINKKQKHKLLWLHRQASKAEILTVIDLLQGSKNVLEIGVGRGMSHVLLKSAVQNVISIDRKLHTLIILSAVLQKIQRLDGSCFILGNSREEVVPEVRDILNGEELDAVYIDGGHHYKAVAADHKLYAPLVKKDGLIFFHDYFHEKGVRKVVDEIAQKHQVYVVVDGSFPLGTAWYCKKTSYSIPYSSQDIQAIDYQKYNDIQRWMVLQNLITEYNLKKGAELGISNGRTYFRLLEKCYDLTLIGVDEWKYRPEQKDVPHGEIYEKHDFHKSELQVRQQAKKYGSRAIILKMSTHVASHQIQDNELDFVFIDASHDYKSIKQDISDWWPKVRIGGFLTGHDYKIVKQAVDEFTSDVKVEGDVWIVRKPK